MTPFVARLSQVVTGVVLLAGGLLLTTDRLEYCGQPDAMRRQIDGAAAAGTAGPTLAPSQKVVFIRVEADKPDLQIGWAEN